MVADCCRNTVCLRLAKEFGAKPDAAVVVTDDAQQSRLMRRIVPHLRSRRPAEIVEAQLAWRQAAEARRRWRHAS